MKAQTIAAALIAVAAASRLSAAQTPDAAAPAKAPDVITVRAGRSEAQRLQESAEAVLVVDTRKAQQQTTDLGEVLARTQGVGVRREGGLGSQATIAMNGLEDEQVRVFLDGVPLQLAGFPFGVANVPVNLIERIEIYRGVVPVRFGADALGGAINLVSEQRFENQVGASYQVGSFGTVRATLHGRYRHQPSGFVLGVASYFDQARNDFWMSDRALPTPEGATILKDVRRFHDGYYAGGGSLEVGVVEKPWAKRLTLQGFGSSFTKDVQHNSLMTVPYGQVTEGETTYGATLRYDVDLPERFELSALANYARRNIGFRDLSTHIYTWEGEQGLAVGRNGARGEIRGEAIDRSIYEDGFFGRVGLSWAFIPGQHTFRLITAPQYMTRIGDDHVPERPDLLGLRQTLFQVVSGVEYEANLWHDRVANVVFVKDYHFTSSAEDRSPVTADIIEREQQIHRFGLGDGLRYRFNAWLLGKVSYEYATRLPTPDEIFGDGKLIEPSANQYQEQLLKPEVSHNLNVGPRIDVKDRKFGAVVLDVNGFLRDSQDMIILLAGKQFVPYANLSDARALGIETAVSFTSPSRLLKLDATFTWQDVRNTSTDGPFAPQKGMRIPSRPYLFGSWGARLRFDELPDPDDTLEPFYAGRWVHDFDRGWDIGDPDYKLSVPAQVSHSLGVSWIVSHPQGRLTSTLEVDNLTDELNYDVYGVQRPGRAVYLKLTGKI